jgi:hypothetical protein
MRPLIPLALGLAAAPVLAPSTAIADSATHLYMPEMEGPNFSTAPNGDMVTADRRRAPEVGCRSGAPAMSPDHHWLAPGLVVRGDIWSSGSSRGARGRSGS